MSAKRETLRERTQRFRRRMRGQNKAVSPVVATLILILIAVAAAAALYLWLVAWQGNITGGIGNQQVQATFTIGGSTSVYPFSSLAVSWYEQNHSDVVIQDDQGGTGAGMLAVCAGHIDVGAASSLETVTGLQSSDGCPSTPGITVTTIAYDAVDVIVPVADVHGLLSVSYDTLTLIYDQASTTTPTLVSTTANGATTPFTGEWGQLPATVPNQVVEYSTAASVLGATLNTYFTTGAGETCGSAHDTACLYANATNAASAGTGAGTPVAGGIVGAVSTVNTVLSATVTGTTTDTLTLTGDSPCGWDICAGGSGTYPATDAVVPVERSDASGTTQTFEARVLAAAGSSSFETSFAGLGFSGCGSNNLLSDCGITEKAAENGNPGVISYVSAHADSIGYASDGLTRASTSGVSCQGVATAACGIGLEYPGDNVAVQPSLGASGSIAGGVVNGGFGAPGLSTTVTVANSYAGARPFEFVTLQPPAGEVEDFFTYITAPDVNQALASASGEVSLYSI